MRNRPSNSYALYMDIFLNIKYTGIIVVLEVRLELTTYRLQGDCTTCCAIPANLRFVLVLFVVTDNLTNQLLA